MVEETKGNTALLTLLSSTALMKPSVESKDSPPSSTSDNHSSGDAQPSAVDGADDSSVQGQAQEGNNNPETGKAIIVPVKGSPGTQHGQTVSPRAEVAPTATKEEKAEEADPQPTSFPRAVGVPGHASNGNSSNAASVSSDSADPPQHQQADPFAISQQRPRSQPQPTAAEVRNENGAAAPAPASNPAPAPAAESPVRPFAMPYHGSAFYPPPGYPTNGPPGHPPPFYAHPPHPHHHHQYMSGGAPMPVGMPPPPHMTARQISPTLHSPYPNHGNNHGHNHNHSQPPKDGNSAHAPYYQHPPPMQPMLQHQHQHQQYPHSQHQHQQHSSREHAQGSYPPPHAFMHLPSTSAPAPTDSATPKVDERPSYEALLKENQDLRAQLAEKEDHLDFLEKQVNELRQLPTGKISHIPIDDMLRIMHEYGSEVSNQTLPQRKSNIKKASIVRQFRRWNPEFFRYFIHVNGEWVPKLGKEGEQRRRMEKRRSLKAQKGAVNMGMN